MDLNFSDWVEKIKNELGKEEWLTVYLHERNEFEQTTFFCALIPNNEVRKSLKDFSWDLHIGGGLPGTSFYYGNGKKGWEYCRFLGRFLTEGVEPLIFSRNFLGLKEEYLEISEEFRHYFNLCEDKGNNKYIFIDDNGDDEEVVLISKDKIQIKLKFIKEFLSVKKMHLAIFFDFMRF